MTDTIHQPPADAPAGRPQRDAETDTGIALVVFVTMSVIGALLGLLWTVWSPDRPPARVTSGGRLQFESEQWVAADGRYLVLIVATGVIAAVLVWTRTGRRGPAMLLGLGAGGLGGAGLTWLVGWLAGGGSDDTQAGGYIPVTRLTLHVPGLVFLEAGVAVLVYGLFVAFAAHDDLGRPDPRRDALVAAEPGPQPNPQSYPPPDQPAYPPPYPPPSVGAGGHPQHGGGDGDAAGPAQQRDLPPQ